MQTGPALRESVVQTTNAVWYILVYGTSAAIVLASADYRLAVPMLLWFVAYVGLLRFFVPRMRDRSRAMSEVRSALTGRIVDSYTNILTVKLFARARDEDAFVREGVDDHTRTYHRQLRMLTTFIVTLTAVNADARGRNRRDGGLALDASGASRWGWWRRRCRSRGRSSTSPAGWRTT